MNKKWIIIGVLSVAIIGALGYLYYSKNKKPNNDKSDFKPIKLEKSPQVDNNSQAVKITENQLNQFKKTLADYEYKNNSLYNKYTGGKISEEVGWSVWGVLNRYYNSLSNGVKNDNSINKETKEYANNVLEEIKNITEEVFPQNIYNNSSKLFKKYNLHKAKETDIYN
jgi:hypothetical protein